MPGTQAGSRGSLAPGPHTTRHAGPHRAVPGTSRPVGRQAGATQITPVEKGQAMTRHRITHPDVRCSTSTWGTIPSSRSLPENSVLGPRASHFFAWQRRRSRRCWFYRRCSRMQPGGKRAGRSQIEFSDRLQGSVLHCTMATTMTSRLRVKLWRDRRLTSAQSSRALPHKTLPENPTAPLGRSPRIRA